MSSRIDFLFFCFQQNSSLNNLVDRFVMNIEYCTCELEGFYGGVKEYKRVADASVRSNVRTFRSVVFVFVCTAPLA